MKMTRRSLFSLRGWAMYENSLSIKLTVDYRSGLSDTSELDLPSCENSPEGISILVDDEDRSGVMHIGADPFSNDIAGFVLEITCAGSVRSIDLEYAIISGGMRSRGDAEYSRLMYDRIVFSVSEDGIDAEMTASGSQEITESIHETIFDLDIEDICGNITADLKIMSYYEGLPEIKYVSEKLKELYDLAEKMDIQSLNAAVMEQENILMKRISSTQEDVRRYRRYVNEDSEK